MTDLCCAPLASGLSRAVCPTNQKVGQLVGRVTLQALLARPLTLVSAVHDYRFCPAPDCPTVYYRADGRQTFGEGDLRERVYQKHQRAADMLVCYCFQYTVGQIRTEIERTGASAVVERITAGIQAGQCACEVRNPQGSCCLGNVLALVRDLAGNGPASDPGHGSIPA